MGKNNSKFKHLSYEQRKDIETYLSKGFSISKIAKLLDVHISTIYREINKGSLNGRYNAENGEQKYKVTLKEKGKEPFEFLNNDIKQYIIKLILEEHLSPKKIILRSEIDFGKPICSTNTLYKAIDEGEFPGITRDNFNFTKLLKNGCIHIPKCIQNNLNLQYGDILDIKIENNTIILTKDK